MPPGLAHRLIERRAGQPQIYLEFGLSDQVPSVIPGVATMKRTLKRTLDSLGVRYTASAFQGGHVDQVRQRVSEHLLPAMGQWFRSDSATAAPKQR
jgi:hypothetical protein